MLRLDCMTSEVMLDAGRIRHLYPLRSRCRRWCSHRFDCWLVLRKMFTCLEEAEYGDFKEDCYQGGGTVRK